MGLQKISTMAVAVLFTASCSAPAPPPPPAKTVFDPLTHDLDRAREVQKTVDENTDATRKAVQAQENGDPTP
jgi:hypothetical protein